MSKIEELYERGGAMVDEMNQIQHKYGYDKELWPAGQRNRWDNLQKATQRAFDEVEEGSRSTGHQGGRSPAGCPGAFQ